MRGNLLPKFDGNMPQLNSSLRYLRVQYNQLPAIFMVLGFVDGQPDHAIETWYSADGEVIQLQNGRLVGTAGLPHDWANVKFTALPQWNALAAGERANYLRQRDSKTNYAYSLTDHVQAIRSPGPSAAQFPYELPALPSTAWWVEETTADLPAAFIAVLPRANNSHAWVYSYQCITPQACLRMQPWPPASSGP